MKHGSINALALTDAAYIAGMIDADGTVTVSIGSKLSQSTAPFPKPLVLVVNTNLELIDWLQLTIGAGTAYETKTRPTRPDQNEAHWNKVHRYQLTGIKAISLLKQIAPFMRVKVRQSHLVMSIPTRGNDFKRFATEEQRALANSVCVEIRRLNQRGKDKAGVE